MDSVKLTWKDQQKIINGVDTTRNSSNHIPQARLRFSQFHRAWTTILCSLLQLEQVYDWTTFLFARLSKVGRELVQAHHAKVLILFGTFSLHKPF